MQWQQTFCSEAKFLLKIDDDLVADLPRLGHWIEQKLAPKLAKEPKVVYGHVLARKFGNAQQVIRDPESKWQVYFHKTRLERWVLGIFPWRIIQMPLFPNTWMDQPIY